MKNVFLLIIGVIISLFKLNAQVETDTLLGENYHINLRLATYIEKEKDKHHEGVPYNPADIWQFLSIEFIWRYGALVDGDNYYKIVNQFKDTAILKVDKVNQYITDDYALIDPERFNLLKKKYPKTFLKMLNEEITIGMTSDQVEFALGLPDRIHSTETSSYYSTQWVYRNGQYSRYLYFRNDKLSVIQD